MLAETSYATIEITRLVIAITFVLMIIVLQFVVILSVFLKNKKLRVLIHNKTFEDLLKDELITKADFNLLTGERIK